jgi:hypothetical protein
MVCGGIEGTRRNFLCSVGAEEVEKLRGVLT